MAYRRTLHSSTGSTLAKLLFNREMRSKLLPELKETLPAYSEARDKDTENKQKRADHANTRRGAQESNIVPVDKVLLKQRKENKLSTTFGKTPYEFTSKSGSEVVVTNPERGSYRSVTEINRFFKDGDSEDPVHVPPSFGSIETQQENYGTGTNRWVLQAAWYQYRQHYGGNVADVHLHKRNRHIAYRPQLVCWCWGILSKEIQVVPPSCAVRCIRAHFPPPGLEGDFAFTGFKHADE